jgi:peptidoglycan/LPS O-acetylase OafA/YrhL
MIIRWFNPSAIGPSPKLAILAGGLAAVGAILLASLSWKYIESPILGWKDELFPVKGTARLLAVESKVEGSDPLCA